MSWCWIGWIHGDDSGDSLSWPQKLWTKAIFWRPHETHETKHHDGKGKKGKQISTAGKFKTECILLKQPSHIRTQSNSAEQSNISKVGASRWLFLFFSLSLHRQYPFASFLMRSSIKWHTDATSLDYLRNVFQFYLVPNWNLMLGFSAYNPRHIAH